MYLIFKSFVSILHYTLLSVKLGSIPMHFRHNITDQNIFPETKTQVFQTPVITGRAFQLPLEAMNARGKGELRWKRKN